MLHLRVSLLTLLLCPKRNACALQPLGSLTQRLRAVASAATLARRQDASLQVVWPQAGDAGFAAAWGDLFSSPELPLGPFPGGTYRYADADCAVHAVASHADYRQVHDRWER